MVNDVSKIFENANDLKSITDPLKDDGGKTVFTNGCFDILHLGHLRYLGAAGRLGDYLIVGVNSDNSVKKLKGSKRPINSLNSRMEFLSYIEVVDFIVPFQEETPYELISLLVPDVLVKGGDWKAEDIVGADIVLDNGGTVESLNFEEGYSTTSIINKIMEENQQL